MRVISPVLSIIPVLLAAGLIAACGDSSDDTSPPVSPSQEAGADSLAPDAATDDAATDGAPKDDAPPDAAPIEAGAAPNYAILVGSDFASTAQATLVDLPTSSVMGRITSDDQDTLPYASGLFGFLLHRTQGKVSVLEGDKPTSVARTLDVNPGPDAGKANPYAVVVSVGSHAYVLRYGQNSIPVIDLATGNVSESIDLSSFVGDSDGLVDMVDGAFDNDGQLGNGRVYVVLQRIDQNEFGGPPDYVGACSGTPALLVGIDTETRKVVDLNGAEQGEAIELKVVNPTAVAWDHGSRSLMVMGVGCADADAGTERVGRGIEKIDVAAGTTSWWWQSTELDRPGSMLFLGARGVLVGTDDANFARHWRLISPTDTKPGEDLAGVPMQPAFDGTSKLIGLAAQEDGGTGYQIVSWDLDTKAATAIAPEAFDKPGLQPYGSATVR